MLLGESGGTVISGLSGVAGIIGPSLTLVMIIPTVALAADAVPQRSTAATIKLVLRTSEPLLTNRSPLLLSFFNRLASSFSVPISALVIVTQLVPLKYCNTPPVGSDWKTIFSALAPTTSLLSA
ncbi:hypothetical protein D3C75_472790 [compost metagenome]